MKQIVGIVICLVILAFMGVGCASTYPAGAFYSNLKLPMDVTSNTMIQTGKVGIASCTAWFGVYASGDASLDTAIKNGNIAKVHYVDWQVKNILGIAKYKLFVYGE